MIELDQVDFGYTREQPVLAAIDFSLAPGERAVVLGANGCGKTTLLKLIAGLVSPSRGTFRFQGHEVNAKKLSDRAWCRDFRRAVGMVFQQPEAMLFNATVLEEIAYGPRRLDMPEPDDHARRWATRMGLEKHLDRAPYHLSGGEKQRLALACVLVCQPKLLLLDEPTSSLDPRATGWLIDYLLDQPDLTTLVSTQNLALATEFGRRALVLGEDGRQLHDGPLDQALADTDLMWQANLAHRHHHRHDSIEHRHIHVHSDWS